MDRQSIIRMASKPKGIFMTAIKIQPACLEDISLIKHIADQNRLALGFVIWASLEEKIARQALLVVKEREKTVGFVSFHHRRDGWTVIHEICVSSKHRGQGIGQKLVEAVQEQAFKKQQRGLRLKCPIDLPANKFYDKLGFVRVSIESGKRRPLAVWEKVLPRHASIKRPHFFLTLSGRAGEIRKILHLWEEGGDVRQPFSHIIFTPLFTSLSTISLIRDIKERLGSVVMFDSGGYQVQMGKVAYEELVFRLMQFYQKHTWANWYVLPDHVPHSRDTILEVEFKVRETLDFARLFLRRMPLDFYQKAIGVVHGRTPEQIARCIEAYAEMGLTYVGFGSFSTSGPKNSVNHLSKHNIELLRLLQMLAYQKGMRVHVFGIGSPSHLTRLAESGVLPTSLDSAGWWKAGGYGNVFFPMGSQLQITVAATPNATRSGIEYQKSQSGHECLFCGDIRLLRKSRTNRILHNLTAMLDTMERLNWICV